MLNALSDANVFVENRLFATLDTTTRSLAVSPTLNILMSDTVGFIRKLPHGLVASFKSTLEEVVEADLLLHVIDTTHPHLEDHIEVVNSTLEEIGAGGKNILFVFNKIDQLPDRSILRELQSKFSPSVAISAQRGINLLGLREKIAEIVHETFEEIRFTIPISEYKSIVQLRNLAEFVKTEYENEVVNIKLRVSKRNFSHVKNIIDKIPH